MVELQEALAWRGCKAVDPAGSTVGTVVEIYLDDDSGAPEWLLVETGLFGTQSSFVPLEGARPEDDGVRVGYAKEVVNDAPRVTPDQSLDPAEEERLYRHYGIDLRSPGQGGQRLRRPEA